MTRKERSHVRKRRHGCLGGCLTRMLLLLGVGALLFVGACVLGFVRNDPQTGKPSLTFENVDFNQPEWLDTAALDQAATQVMDAARGLSLPDWAYGVSAEGLTVKTLRAGDAEAVLVCCDGYTMLLGGGRYGLLTCAQLLLCGVNDLNVAAALGADDGQLGGMDTVVSLLKPDYLLYQDTQVKQKAYYAMLEAAQKNGRIRSMVPTQGLTFSLGRATVSVIGPARTAHSDERDDGLSVRIDYGATSVLVMGTITAEGEQGIVASRAPLDADVLICSLGGDEEATCLELVQAVTPDIALMTGKSPANSVKVRLERVGAKVYTQKEHGVMTVVSDGQKVTVRP